MNPFAMSPDVPSGGSLSRPWWYICSPYAPRPLLGETMAQHVRWAQWLARWAYDQGAWPIAPHLYAPQFLDDSMPTERACGVAWGLTLLTRCTCVVVPQGIVASPGMIAELALAREYDLPVMAVRLPASLLDPARAGSPPRPSMQPEEDSPWFGSRW